MGWMASCSSQFIPCTRDFFCGEAASRTTGDHEPKSAFRNMFGDLCSVLSSVFYPGYLIFGICSVFSSVSIFGIIFGIMFGILSSVLSSVTRNLRYFFFGIIFGIPLSIFPRSSVFLRFGDLRDLRYFPEIFGISEIFGILEIFGISRNLRYYLRYYLRYFH